MAFIMTTNKIYARPTNDGGYWLVNKDGECVNLNGELAYVPLFYIGCAEDSGLPVWKEKEDEK